MDHPGPSDGRTPDIRWKMIKDRYGKPVLSPNDGADVPDSGCPGTEQSFGKIVTMENTSRNGTRFKQVGRNRFRKPGQPPVRGVGVTNPDRNPVKQRRSLMAETTTDTKAMNETIPARYNMPLNNGSVDEAWHTVTTKNRYIKLTETDARKLDDFDTNKAERTVVTDRCADPVTTARPAGGPSRSVTAGGLRSDDMNDGHDRCLSCHEKKRMSGSVRINADDVRKPLSGRSTPIVNGMIPSEVIEPMHYQWILRESVMKADRTVPSNYLEIPDQEIPRMFLQLAEEARKVVVINEPSGFSEEVMSQGTQLSGPILVEVMTRGHQMPCGGESVNDIVMTEMVTESEHVGRCSPMVQAGRVVLPVVTGHPVRPGLIASGQRTVSAELGGLDHGCHERYELSDEHGLVALLGSDVDGNGSAPVIPVSRDLHLMERRGPVDRSCPVDTQVMSEPSVLLGQRTDWMDDTAVGPVGQEGSLSEPDAVSHQRDSTGLSHEIDRPVFTEKREDTPAGPVGVDVVLTMDRCGTNRPDPVGQPSETEQSVFPSPEADQEGCIPTDSVHPEVMMLPIQPGAAGPAGPDGVRRSVSHVRMCPGHDDDRQTAGGPLGRFPYSDLLLTSAGSVLNDDRQDEVEGRPSLFVPLTNIPRTTEHRNDRTGEVDYDSTTQTRSEPGCATGVWDPVVPKDIGFQTVLVNVGPDDGLTDSRDVSRSSDSGVHSWTEQWENMSENSMDSSHSDTGDLHRSISNKISRLMFGTPPHTEDEGDSDYPGTDGSLTETLGRCPSEAMSDRNEDITYSTMTDGNNDRNSDIAALSDFSDDSSILGVRKVLRRRVPYRGRGLLRRKGCAPAPRTPPVKARNKAEEFLFKEDSTRSSWTRWSYGALPDCTTELFARCVRPFTAMRLAKDADPRLDRYYPKLVQSLARAGRVVMKIRNCRENHSLRRDLMLRLFDEEMEKTDLVSARFPDRHVYQFVRRPAPPLRPTEVLGTYTPPIHRKRARKYVGTRENATDVEDYFVSEGEEEFWIQRAEKWYQPCV